MSKILSTVTIAIGLSLLTGCAEITTDKQVVSNVTETRISDEYASSVADWCYDILKQKSSILVAAQLKPEACKLILKDMQKAGELYTTFSKDGRYPKTVAVIELINTAQYQLSSYIDSVQYRNGEKSGTYFMQATNCFDKAIQIVNK